MNFAMSGARASDALRFEEGARRFGMLGLGTFAGLKIVESPDIPRYTLPAELMPGVPWPPGFRDDINRWSRSFLGTTNVVPRGQMYVVANQMVVMRPEDVVRVNTL